MARNPGQTSDSTHVIMFIAILIVMTGYFVAFSSGRCQATFGKRLLGIHLITISGKRVGRRLAFARCLAYAVSVLPFYIGFLIIGWSDQKKEIHDMICGTRIV
jgi:uncharacterized RDD family membrane protein YckC